MKAVILDEAEDDLERAFDYYQSVRQGLGVEMLHEYRRGIDQMLLHPQRVPTAR